MKTCGVEELRRMRDDGRMKVGEEEEEDRTDGNWRGREGTGRVS